MHLPLCAKRVRELCMLEPDVMIILQRALLEGGVDLDTDDRTDEDASPGGHTGYTREPGDITKLSLSESSPVSDWQPASSFAAYGVDMHEKSDLSRLGGPSVNEGSQTDAKHSDSSPSMTPRTSVRASAEALGKLSSG